MPEFDCPTPIDVSVRVPGGTLDIVAEDRPTASVDVSPYDNSEASRDTAANVRVDFHDGHLVVLAPEWSVGWIFRRAPRLRVSIRVPSDSTITVKLASADARCQGRFASAAIDSASGDIMLDEVTGNVSAKLASGDMTVKRAGGDVHVSTASGDLKVGYAGGDVSLTSASGDVEIKQADASVEAKTASGDIGVGVASRGAVRINTASGDVRIGVAAGTGVWLDISSISGDTTSDLAVSESSEAGGAAQLTLQIRTMSGDIEVRRVQLPAAA
jgi:DUF4097 and DUF4098 domain-containing protein YvlB